MLRLPPMCAACDSLFFLLFFFFKTLRRLRGISSKSCNVRAPYVVVLAPAGLQRVVR